MRRRPFGARIRAIRVFLRQTCWHSTAARDNPWAPALLAGVVLFSGASAGFGETMAPVGEPASEASAARDVLLITIDTLRADALGFAGNSLVDTAAIDRLAKQGRWFSQARAHAVTTLPSHTSILTGRLPVEHGVRGNGFRYDGRFETLAERLSDQGFATAAVVAAFPLAARFGLDAGFEHYDGEFGDPSSGRDLSYAERPGREVVARAEQWWLEHSGKRRFLWLHLFEPHAPYLPIDELRQRFAKRPYLGEVSSADRLLAPLLELFLEGRDRNTLIVLSSDHGESLGEHGELTHGLFAYDATLAVPLVLWGPGVELGRDDRLAGHIDIVPTVLAATGLPADASLAGRSLLAPPLDAEPEAIAVHHFEALTGVLHYGFAPLRGLVSEGFKLIDLPLPELYELTSDPHEKSNLHDSQPLTVKRLSGRLSLDPAWFEAGGSDVSPEATRGLASLGYLGGPSSGRSQTVFDEADDPKRWIHLDRQLARAVRLDAQGEYGQAVEVLEQVIAERPSIPVAHEHLAFLQLELGQTAAALTTMEAAFRAGWASVDLTLQFGQTLLGVERAAAALEVLKPLGRRYPSSPSVLAPLSQAQLALGRTAAAEATLQRSLQAEPDRVETHEGLALVGLFSENFELGERHARRALELEPRSLSAWRSLAVLLSQQGKVEAAVAALESALAIAPEDPLALFQLGMNSLSIGREESARVYLARFLSVAATNSAFKREVELARQALL